MAGEPMTEAGRALLAAHDKGAVWEPRQRYNLALIGAAIRDIEAEAAAERDALRRALAEYGAHYAYCPRWTLTGPTCICGLEAVLSPAAPIAP